VRAASLGRGTSARYFFDTRMLPAAFRSKKTLERLNMVGVGASLAALTGVVLAALFHDPEMFPFVTSIPTLLIGMGWVTLLRWEKQVSGASVRLGWILSIPLAVLNAALAGGALLAFDRIPGPWIDAIKRFVAGMFFGATFGAVVWIPALVMTLALFGAPIAWSQRLAKKGLAGKERGEGIVGGVSASVALLALLATLVTGPQSGTAGAWWLRGLATLGVTLGVAALGVASARAEQRRRFVEAVERGEVDHFRVDTSDEGKVLVRVVSQGQGYRVADYEEEIASLDGEGELVAGVRVDPAR
jgi:hypothetical protein